MKTLLRLTVCGFAVCLMTTACSDDSAPVAEFSDFNYTVTLPESHEVASPDWAPLLPGCYPDPSIVRVGDDYYLVNSSFAFYPGVPIWHSTDLKNWERLGYVLNRPSQLSLPDSIRISGGIYAPDISYNPHNETFYMVTTLVDNGGNFYVTTKNPKEGNWSDPVWIPEVGGIDPSFFFDSDGKAYIVNNDGPEGEALYDGHRTIRIHDFDWKSGKVVGESKVSVDGGVDISQKPIWIEGPHLYHIGDRYFLMCAEGGTGPDHREVIFESDSPEGPFKPCKINPILTQRGLDPFRPDPVTCAGHADLVEDKSGKWWAVFLGVRPYSPDGHDIMGRETFIHPVSWKGGQPVISDRDEVLVGRPQQERESALWTDSALVNEAFFIRSPRPDFFSISPEGSLLMEASPIVIADRKSPSAIGRWATENAFEVSVTVDRFGPETPADIAGLLLYQDDSHYIVFGKSVNKDGDEACVVRTVNGEETEEMDIPLSLGDGSSSRPLKLKINADGKGLYNFSFSEPDPDSDEESAEEGSTTGFTRPVPASILSTRTAGNFTGTMVGVYATSSGK